VPGAIVAARSDDILPRHRDYDSLAESRQACAGLSRAFCVVKFHLIPRAGGIALSLPSLDFGDEGLSLTDAAIQT
jgi:hypothetical protein